MAAEQEQKITHKRIPYWTGMYCLTFGFDFFLLHVLFVNFYTSWYYCVEK